MRTHAKPSKKTSQAEVHISPASLVVLAGPRFGETIALMKGKNIIGSDPLATIHFLTSLLSNRHFILLYQERRVVLTREEGITMVNNIPVEEKTLKDGDLIGAKGILLRYVQEGIRDPTTSLSPVQHDRYRRRLSSRKKHKNRGLLGERHQPRRGRPVLPGRSQTWDGDFGFDLFEKPGSCDRCGKDPRGRNQSRSLERYAFLTQR